jgi:pyridoxamine 5'-phosphate oxidase
MDLGSERREYGGDRLLEADTPSDPFALFTSWLDVALEARLLDATAMGLATVSEQGRPSVRMVLLKGHDRMGLVFYTRYSTQKCKDLELNPHGALLFHWREFDRQVRVEGPVERTSMEASRAYFATRPRASQLAARAASGLDRVASADELEKRFKKEAEQHEGRDVPMPDDWGGYRLSPVRFEFWQGRPSRLHDRLTYALEPGGTWSKQRLAP